MSNINSLSPSVSELELARYIATDWQPFSPISPLAVEVVRQFLNLIVRDRYGDWVMTRKPNQLTRGWKGMISEAVSIAFSRHSASDSKGYDFCAHVDHFLPGGFLHLPDLDVRKLKGHQRRFRPDYLLAASNFRPYSAADIESNRVGSMEVKGKSRSIIGKVSKDQKKQSKNLLLYRIHSDGSKTNIPIRQKLLSQVRCNNSLEGLEQRTVAVRHSNSLDNSEKEDPALFFTVVMAHYMRVIDQITEQEIRPTISTFFRAFHSEDPFKEKAGLHILSAINAREKKLQNSGLFSISPELNQFFEMLFRGKFQKFPQDDQIPILLAEELKRIEEASAKRKASENKHYGKDGIIFHLR